MSEPGGGNSAPHQIAFEAFGVRVCVSASDPHLMTRVIGLLPPGSRPCPPDAVEGRFVLNAEPSVGFRILAGEDVEHACADEDVAVGVFDALLRSHVAFHAPDRIFVHAGVVAHRGRAIVMPGPTLTGKSTLVAALVRAGGVYYSDEYAVVDQAGLIHAYPRRLSLRGPSLFARDVSVESLGGRTGGSPVPVGVVAITTYRADAEWAPERRSEGAGMLALLANAVPAHQRPGPTLAAVRAAVAGALVLESDRGEAGTVADALLAAADRTSKSRLRA